MLIRVHILNEWQQCSSSTGNEKHCIHLALKYESKRCVHNNWSLPTHLPLKDAWVRAYTVAPVLLYTNTSAGVVPFVLLFCQRKCPLQTTCPSSPWLIPIFSFYSLLSSFGNIWLILVSILIFSPCSGCLRTNMDAVCTVFTVFTVFTLLQFHISSFIVSSHLILDNFLIVFADLFPLPYLQ